MLPNYPDENCKWLSPEEKRTLLDSLPETQPKAGARTWNSEQVKALFRDPTFPTFTLIWVCHAIGGWGISTVLPTVIYELGLTNTAVAQLMTMVRQFLRAEDCTPANEIQLSRRTLSVAPALSSGVGSSERNDSSPGLQRWASRPLRVSAILS